MSKRPIRFKPEDSLYVFTVNRPVSILMVVLAVAVFGWVCYQRLSLTLMPNMSYPTLTVRTVYPGTAPEEMESVIARPLEQQLGVVPKLVSISSISKAGQSDVILEFQWKTDMDVVAQEVREKVDRLRMPDGAQRPLLLHYDPSLDPILRVGLAGPQSLYELRHLAEHEIKRRLEALPGVAAIQVKGGLEEEFLVALDESKLANLKLDITQIGQRLQSGNVNMPGGNLREGQTEYVIRTLNEFRTIEEIGNLIVSRSNNAIDIRLRDIATITRFHKDRSVITRVNGRESVELEIFKEADANVVVVATIVRNALFGTPEQQEYVAQMKADALKGPDALEAARIRRSSGWTASFKSLFSGKRAGDGKKPGGGKGKTPPEARKENQAAAMAAVERARIAAEELVKRRAMTSFVAGQLPPGATLELLADQSVFISRSIDEVKSNAISGAVIAIVVLFLFLRNITQTLIISLTIPISIVATFAPMYMADVSLNIISLGGLALGVGMLVDNGIVVLESIFRCREEGDDLRTAVVRGTQEVGMAVVASTLTTVAVFLPIVFVEGVAGQVFGDMALTVVFSLLASLVAALFLIPMLAAQKFSGPDGLTAHALSSGYLHIAPPPRGVSFLARPFHVLAVVLSRILQALLILLVLPVKFLAVCLLLAFSPALAIWEALEQRRSRARPVGRLGKVAAAWERVTIWAAADNFGPIRALSVWPGMLSFVGLPRMMAGYAHASSWLLARRWRWVVLVVVPALGLGVLLLTRAGAPPVPPPVWSNGPPAEKPWYLRAWQWSRAQPWWLLVLVLVPGVLPFVFMLARAATELVLRFLGSLAQTTALILLQLVTGAFRAFGAIGGQATDRGLAWFESGYMVLQNGYPLLIAASLRRRGAILGCSVAAFLACWFFILPRLGKELIPQVNQGEFNLDVTLPIGTPLERTAEMASRIDSVVRRQPEIERTALTVGAEEGATTSIEAGEHTARLTVRLKSGLASGAEPAVIDRIRAAFHDLPEVKLEVSYPTLFSFRSPIEVEIRGHDLAALKRLSRETETLLSESVPGLVDVRSTLQAGHPEIQVIYQRDRLAEYGLNLRSVADLVRNKVQGRTATEFRKEDQMIDIVVRLREQDRFGIEELRGLIINPGGAVPMPLSAVADLSINEGPSEIRRVDQQRTALITANIDGADLSAVSRNIALAMDSIVYPPGFTYAIAGQNKEMKTSLDSLVLAFALALFLVYIVMASQFESLVQPLLIMMTVPLALIGVALTLWVARIPLSIMVFLGLIILAGIVVNNAIVLVDYINTLRSRGLELTLAISEAGRARLRPIMMTTLTTVLGLVPMALGLGDGAEIRAPMAITVIVGLSTSTLLTLVVIPTLYYQFPGKVRLQSPVSDPDAEDDAPRVDAPADPEPMAK